MERLRFIIPYKLQGFIPLLLPPFPSRIGSVKLKVLPFPSPLLSAQILPPCALIMPLQIDSPNPVPPYFLEILLSTWKNLTNSLSRTALLMPMPSSVTRTSTLSLIFWASTTILPLAGVNLMALSNRFAITWVIL